MTDTVDDTGPLDWRIAITDKGGRPTPEFQRRWNTQRNNNALIPADFIQLQDVPNSYTGDAGNIVRVKSGANGLEFDTISAILDSIGAARGDILYRGATGWVVLAPGTASQLLQTGGAGANPSWVNAPSSLPSIANNDLLANISGSTAQPIGLTLSALIDSAIGNTQGDILYRSATGWSVLAPGTSGQVLATGGSGANPSWVPQSSGTVVLPGSVPDLAGWWESDNLTGTTGLPVVSLLNRVPNFAGASWNQAGTGAKISTSTLNGLPYITFPNSTAGRYTNGATFGAMQNGATIFAVFSVAGFTTPSTIVGGFSGCLQLRASTTGFLQANAEGTTTIGTSTTLLTANTWYQANFTYAGPGAYAFRVNRATAGSGTSSQTLSGGSNGIGYNGANANEEMNGSLALVLLYPRVLTSTEIGNVETYIHNKWNV